MLGGAGLDGFLTTVIPGGRDSFEARFWGSSGLNLFRGGGPLDIGLIVCGGGLLSRLAPGWA